MKGGHLIHRTGVGADPVGDVGHGFRTDPAFLFLDKPERGQDERFPGRIPCCQPFEFGIPLCVEGERLPCFYQL